MKIKKIELIGFKSFAEKTTIPLDDGITCIVGPNGCGKSNIVDAFRWVLGEQSAKSLRGEKMEEVIFQGTDSKKQKGMSEVCLTLSLQNNLNNAEINKENHPDFIHVSRRLYRSGESEYLINKKQCRLKDIRDLLLDTGLDVKSYSILDQHRIAEIVNSKPQDRRFLIEEIAGVMKYKVRKAEAEAKLDSSKQNLVRINDIVTERKRQLNSLDRLARKAEKYKKLLSEANEIEIKLTRYKHFKIDEELHELLKEVSNLEMQATTNKAYISEISNKIETLKLELTQYQKELLDTDTLLNRWNKELSEAEKKSAIIKTHIENYKNEVQRLDKLIIETQDKQKASQSKLSELQTINSQYESLINSLNEKILNQAQILKSIESKIKENEIVADSLRKDIFKKSEEISAKRNELNKKHSHLEHLAYKGDIANRDKEILIKTVDSIEKDISKMKKNIEDKTSELNEIQTERQTVLNKIKEIEHNSNTIRQKLSKYREDLASNISRLESINELYNNNPTVNSLSNTLKKKFLTLSNMITVDNEYERAIESLLFEKLHAIEIDSLEDLESIMKIINEKNLVRTTLFYNNFSNSIKSVPEIINLENTIGRVSDHIYDNGSNEKLVKILKNELSNTYMVNSITDAMTFFQNHQHNNITFVTPDGAIIDSNGWVTYGKGTEVLKHKRQCREIELLINTLKTDIATLEQQIEILAREKTDFNDRSSQLQTILLAKDKELSLTRHSLEEAEKDLQRKKRRLDAITSEFSTLKSEKEIIKADIEKLQLSINEVENFRDTLQKDITNLQQAISNLRIEFTKTQETDTAFKLEKTSISEKLEATNKEINSLEKFLLDFENNIANYIKNKSNTENIINKETLLLQNLESNMKNSLKEIDKLLSKQREIKDTITSYRDELNSLENTLSDVRDEVDKLTQNIFEHNQKIFEKKLIKENYESEISQKHCINLVEIPFYDIDIDEHSKNLDELLSLIHI
ncbi:MAG: AAA family ATPase, partial [Thermodesulfovibrionales bacterium]|nr:AAA family ATPase [Thermodesulfovibrionales bacterium]